MFSVFWKYSFLSPAIVVLDVSVLAKPSNPCCCSLSLPYFLRIPDYMQNLSEKYFRTSWRVQGVSPARTSEFEILAQRRAALFDCAMPCVRSSPEKSILNNAAQVKRQSQTQIPGENPKL